eukprot:644984-Rhodomonas_salina.1
MCLAGSVVSCDCVWYGVSECRLQGCVSLAARSRYAATYAATALIVMLLAYAASVGYSCMLLAHDARTLRAYADSACGYAGIKVHVYVDETRPRNQVLHSRTGSTNLPYWQYKTALLANLPHWQYKPPILAALSSRTGSTTSSQGPTT